MSTPFPSSSLSELGKKSREASQEKRNDDEADRQRKKKKKEDEAYDALTAEWYRKQLEIAERQRQQARREQERREKREREEKRQKEAAFDVQMAEWYRRQGEIAAEIAAAAAQKDKDKMAKKREEMAKREKAKKDAAFEKALAEWYRKQLEIAKQHEKQQVRRAMTKREGKRPAAEGAPTAAVAVGAGGGGGGAGAAAKQDVVDAMMVDLTGDDDGDNTDMDVSKVEDEERDEAIKSEQLQRLRDPEAEAKRFGGVNREEARLLLERVQQLPEVKREPPVAADAANAAQSLKLLKDAVRQVRKNSQP